MPPVTAADPCSSPPITAMGLGGNPRFQIFHANSSVGVIEGPEHRALSTSFLTSLDRRQIERGIRFLSRLQYTSRTKMGKDKSQEKVSGARAILESAWNAYSQGYEGMKRLPKYVEQEYAFTKGELAALEASDSLLTEKELEVVESEPDVNLRKLVFIEYVKRKLPDSPNQEELAELIVLKSIGYGRMATLIADPDLEEVMVNGIHMPVFVFHRKHGMCKTDIRFDTEAEIEKIVDRLCDMHDKKVEDIIDFSTIDGSRINITRGRLALHGTCMTIRRQKMSSMTITELINNRTLSLDLAALLWLCVDGMRVGPANVVIAGTIGSGKTTLLNALLMLTPPEERIVTIEETPELRLAPKENWIPLSPTDGRSIEDLVKNTLRMRPTMIIVGEIRGSEAISLFNAMNVGRKGMGTLHASSPREAIERLESPPMNVASKLVDNLDLIVVMNFVNIGGKSVKRVMEVAEISGREEDLLLLGTLYRWSPDVDTTVEDKTMACAAYLEKLANKMGVKKIEAVRELEKRKQFLASLIERKVFDYKEVLAEVDKFYEEQV